MGLTIINETVTSLCKTKHGFSDKEKEFVVSLHSEAETRL